MEKHCVVLENDRSIDDQRFVNNFYNSFEGRRTLLTDLRTRTKEEIFSTLSTATDIAVQSTFSYGAEEQLHSIIKVLSKIPHSINIHIYYIGDGLYKFLCRELEASELISIEHHNLLEFDGDCDGLHVLDFKSFTQPYKDKLLYEENYKLSSRNRPTGKKVKVVSCNGFGPEFTNLPLGEVVDVLDFSEFDPNPKRGVWIWGNGAPIKLVNDCGAVEYEYCESL